MEDKFIDSLFKELDKQGIPKTKFFSDLNISRTTVINWKKDSQPLTGNFLKICKYLNVSPYYLWFGEEEEFIKQELLDKAKKYDVIKHIVES